MSEITVGIYLPCGVNVTPEPIFISDDDAISRVVGGTIGSVTTNCDSNKMLFIGYLNDDALTLDLGYNYLATNLFRKEIFGDVVVVWGLNEDGEADGWDHDIPDSLFGALTETLTESTATAYNMSVGMGELMAFALQYDLVDPTTAATAIAELHRGSLNGAMGTKEFRDAVSTVIGICGAVAHYTEPVDKDEDEAMWAMHHFAVSMKEAFEDAHDL